MQTKFWFVAKVRRTWKIETNTYTIFNIYISKEYLPILNEKKIKTCMREKTKMKIQSSKHYVICNVDTSPVSIYCQTGKIIT